MEKKTRFASRDKVRGCILGGAVGDALGYPVEFFPHNELVDLTGEGVTCYLLNHDGVAEISDDTQMSLFTATGLLFGVTRSMNNDFCANPELYVKYHYLDWYKTQTMSYEDSISSERVRSWLTKDKRMYNRRAPGNTCMEALEAITLGYDVENFSKGNGGVMRVAPIAVCNDFAYQDEKMTSTLAALCAEITHHHIMSSVSAAALVLIIGRIVKSCCPPDFNFMSEIVRQSATDAIHTHRGYSEEFETYYEENPRMCEEFLGLINRAINFACEGACGGHKDIEYINELGKGWVAEEALAIAVFCALRHPDNFKDAVLAAVNHDGDTDTTGAICGNIMGALLGEREIPGGFFENLELKDVIEEVADDLYKGCCKTGLGLLDNISKEEAAKWASKYIDLNP